MKNREEMPDIPDPPHRQFKGVWICAALWDHPDLNPTEKFLLAEIDSLCGKGQACYAGNEHLAKHLKVSPAHMRDMLANLTVLGFILRLAFTGRQTLRCVNPEISSDPKCARQLINRYRNRTKPRGNGQIMHPHHRGGLPLG